MKVLQAKGMNYKEYACLVQLWEHESHWNYRAKNVSSTAQGIGQLLIEKSHNPATQIRDGIRYISYRYGNPCNAWSYWQAHYWY